MGRRADDRDGAEVRRRLAFAALALICAAAGLALAAAGAHASFHTVDGTLNVDSSRSAEDARIADVGGAPYVVWSEPTQVTGGLVFVKRFDGASWVPVGGALNFDATKGAGHAGITSVGAAPFAAWQETDGTRFQIRAARFDGTSWVPVGASLNVDTNQAATAPSIASVGGVPYVAWGESITTPNDYQIDVKRLNANGTTWDSVGTPLNVSAAQPGFAPSIADVGGVPYVTWYEGTTARQVYVKKFNGSAWVSAGSGSLNVDATKDATNPRIAAIGGVPYVAWEEQDSSAGQVWVKRFDGTNWVAVGSSLNTDPARPASSPSIAGVGTIPYVSWSDGATGISTVRAARFDGTSWITIGGAINSDPQKGGIPQSLGVVGGFPYVAWTELTQSIAHLSVGRQLPPTCSGSSVAVGHDTPVTIPLSCFDALGLAIASNPAHGTLSPVNQLAKTVTYTPNRGSSGPDSFTFKGNDGTFDSSVAPISLTVAGAPAPAVAAVSSLKVKPHTFPAAGRGAQSITRTRTRTRTRARRTGTTISYRDTQAATTTFTVLRPRRGIKRARKCVKPRRGQHGRRCTRYVAVGKFTHRDRAGANSFHFTGRVRGHKLSPGSYRLRAVPRFARRNGRTITASFRIVR